MAGTVVVRVMDGEPRPPVSVLQPPYTRRRGGTYYAAAERLKHRHSPVQADGGCATTLAIRPQRSADPSNDEIAALTGTSRRAVDRHLRRAHAALRNA